MLPCGFPMLPMNADVRTGAGDRNMDGGIGSVWMNNKSSNHLPREIACWISRLKTGIECLGGHILCVTAKLKVSFVQLDVRSIQGYAGATP